MTTETIQTCDDCGDTLRNGHGTCPDCGKVLCADCLDIDARCLSCLKKHDAALCAVSLERE